MTHQENLKKTQEPEGAQTPQGDWIIKRYTPSTMDEIEWDDKEHHLAEAFVGNHEAIPALGKKVIMLSVNNFGKIRSLDTESWETWSLSPARLTPTGRKYRLEPDTPEQQALARGIFGSFPKHAPEDEPVFNMSKTYIDKDGDRWKWREVEYSDDLGEWVCYHRLGEGELTWEPIPPVIYGPYTEED